MHGCLKNIYLFVSLDKSFSHQSSCVERLSDPRFQNWKIIPLYLIKKHPGKNTKFNFHWL